ncbi:MAG: hypothetical protein AB1762_18865 [Gemmatimonadota bacterium]
MKSRLIDRLESRIADAKVESERDRFIAQRAALLARAGQIAAARDEIAALRQKYASSGSAELTILINIADGLGHYFEDMGPQAEDRFRRALMLARAIQDQELAAHAASWLALVHYGAYRFSDMARLLDESLCTVEIRNSETLARFSLTIAQTFHLANRFDIALSWYRRTQRYASLIEDEMMLSALMHNMASIWAANARNALLGGPSTSDESSQALLGTLSTLNFDEMVGLSGLSVFTPLLQAQILSLEKRYVEAQRLYARYHGSFNLHAVPGWQAWLAVDRGWCELQIGNSHVARSLFEDANLRLSSDLHVDDRAATLARLAQGFEALGESSVSESLQLQAAKCWGEFALLQKSMLRTMTTSPGVTRLHKS